MVFPQRKESDEKMKKYRSVFILLCLLSLSVTTLANASDDKLVVYYFHKTFRCPSCILLEELTHDAVKSGFGPDINAGRIELKVVNLDEPGNAFFENHYQLEFQSVVLSWVVNGQETRWKNLSRVWDYLHEEDKFFDYIQKEISLFIKNKKE
jgi:hypothetical protein